MDILNEVTNPRLRAMIELCRREIPGFEIRFKTDSPWMKFLNIFAQIFNKRFMTDYTTTTGSYVYFPSKKMLMEHSDSCAATLAHELIHMDERKRQGTLVHFLRYAFPQILAVLALLAIFGLWEPAFLGFLVFLLALAPLPAIGRMEIEVLGYTMSMATFYWRYNTLADEDFERIADQFTGASYYFMWPFRKNILRRLKLNAQGIRTGDILQNRLYREVHDIYKTYR